MFERIYDDNTRLVRLFGILTSFLNHVLATQCLFVFSKFATPVAERLGALFLNLSIISPLGSSLALATCETRQVLLVGVPGVFSRGPPVCANLLIGPSHMS